MRATRPPRSTTSRTVSICPSTKFRPCQSAFIAIEDARYYQHHGVDVVRILGAFFNNLKNERVQGGSTITQQLVKQTSLTGVQKMSFKIQEA